ncbi:hypothetical protein ADK90_38335 [Streptomyces sp. XY413]|uniref:hypothetical protein n=1 Tax=Streptomyces sp. XY413 TaxID=1519479 RepID=UPI0006AE9FCD|nr:hypothetical protein [Streptomyces sp. XY413]KOV13288.1 hypothetical protein ADK90_38335 [Streptomyces sp. XY413]
MYIGQGTFNDVPLSTLFPQLSATGIESLQRSAHSVAAAQSEVAAKGWDWFPEHAVYTGPQCRTHVILLLCDIRPSGPGDWLEFQLQVGWTDQGQHEVTASVNVGCWCESDHSTHDVDILKFAVGDKISLPHAFEACAERMTGWLADPRDADFWRAREDLPARRL